MQNQVVLTGNLEFLNLGEIMQLLGGSGSTGILRLISQYASTPGLVYFDNGNPINASNGSLVGLDALYALFGWTEGEFEFSQERIQSEKLIKKSRMSIILDGLRMLDDGQIEKIGPVSFDQAQAANAQGEESIPVIKGPLVDYMYVVDEEDFYEGERIIEEGKHGSWVWVVLEGVVDMVKETPQGPISVFKVGDGAFVGSMSSFLVQDHTRIASAVALGNVQLGVLDSERLAQEYAKMAPELKGFILSLDNRLRQAANCAVDIYCNRIRVEDVVKNKKILIQQGDREDRLFKIVQGRASIVRQTSPKKFVPLAVLHRGDYLGQVPITNLGQEPEGASVLVSKDFKLAPVDLDRLRQHYEGVSDTFKNMIDNAAACIAAASMVAVEFTKNA
jgi:CRP-like cAMP-binding protein